VVRVSYLRTDVINMPFVFGCSVLKKIWKTVIFVQNTVNLKGVIFHLLFVLLGVAAKRSASEAKHKAVNLT